MTRRALCFTVLVGVLGCAMVQGPARGVEPGIELDEATRDRCLTILREGLGSSEFWPSMHAAEALTLVGHADEVRAAIASKVPKETDDQHRCGLARELVRAGDLAATRTLLEILVKPDPHGHVHACESLFKVGQIGDGESLRQVFKSGRGKPSLGIMAAAALARWGNPEALASLRKSVNAKDAETARITAWVLARVGDATDLPALREGLKRFEDPVTRGYFEHALAALGDPEGRKILLKNLTNSDPMVRVYAAEFAPEAKAVEAKEGLIRLLEDPVLDVRVRSAQALLLLAKTGPARPAEGFSKDVFSATKQNPRYSEGSVIVLRDGRLLYTTTEFAGDGSDFARARIIAVESTDDGLTWGPSRVVQENVGKNNVMSVTLRRLLPKAVFDGPIGMFYLVKNSATDLDVYLRVSNDEGATFGAPIHVTAEPDYHVLNNDRVTVLSSGRLVVPVATSPDVSKEYNFVCSCYVSDDQGKTWRRTKGRLPYPKRGAMEPEVVELRDGRLLMHIRTQFGHIAMSESTDQGETWSEPRDWGVRAPEAPSTLRHVPSTGDLLLIWNDCYREKESHGGNRSPLTAAISSDDGKSWTHKRDLETNPKQSFAYTSIVFHKGRALLTYYVADNVTGWISSRFRSVPIEWLYGRDRHAASQNGSR